MVGIPYLSFGQTKENSIGVDTVIVKIRNETTNDILSTTTDSNGLYVVDLSDFTSGYADGDKITVYTIYKNFEGQETFTIALATSFFTEQDIDLSVVIDNELIDYCSVQDVYDRLDGKTNDDITTAVIVKEIQRAEGLIDVKTGTFFKRVTRTDEVHTVDRYSADTSPDQLDMGFYNQNSRRDSMTGFGSNRFKTDFKPVVSITSLSINQAAFTAADDFTVLTEQTGSGGDFTLEEPDAGIIDFINNFPRFGKRSWKVTYVAGYDRTSSDRKITSMLKIVEDICILLATQRIITTKSSGAIFDTTRDIKIGAIELKGGAKSSSEYLASIDPQLKELWKELGELGIEVI